MLWIIIGSILSIVAIILLCILNSRDKGKVFRPNIIVAVLPLALCIFVASVAVVPANNVGVIYSPFRGVSTQTLPEGMHQKGVLDKVYNISTEIQTSTLQNISGQTKDSQYITMVVDVKYRVDSAKAYEVFRQFRDLNNVSKNLIAPVVQRSIEAVSTQFNVIDILGEGRNDLYKGIENELKTRFAESGISFYSINFVDTDAGVAIEQAIQAEAVAKKAVETAEQERLKAEIEAQKRVVEAQANKDKAAIEAETKIIEAEAEAKANAAIANSITPQLLEKMEMEARLKWGWVTVQGGSVITDAR